ncbi:MAG: S8 family serine peptidase [Gemmobacter sp.]|nr:S8 family serine peptidase [Gemmobacter sp.]
MSDSWGRSPLYTPNQSLALDPSVSSQKRIEQSLLYIAETGRGGLGTINVLAAGNDALNANGDGLNASRFTMTIAATESDGLVADYSNFGTSILLAAPASAVTTDRAGRAQQFHEPGPDLSQP